MVIYPTWLLLGYHGYQRILYVETPRGYIFAICLSVCPNICPCAPVSVSPSAWVSVCLFVRVCPCPCPHQVCVYVLFSLYVWLCVWLFACECLYVCVGLCVTLSVWLCVCLCVCVCMCVCVCIGLISVWDIDTSTVRFNNNKHENEVKKQICQLSTRLIFWGLIGGRIRGSFRE